MDQQRRGIAGGVFVEVRGVLAEGRYVLAGRPGVPVDERGVPASGRGLFADERGTATIEYLIVLVCVTIGVAFALIEMGPAVVEVFRARVFWLSLPFP